MLLLKPFIPFGRLLIRNSFIRGENVLIFLGGVTRVIVERFRRPTLRLSVLLLPFF